MKKSLPVIILVAALAAGAGFWFAQQKRQVAAIPADARLIDFTLPDLQGKPQALGQWKGKTILLNFWATWCPPCRKEIPLFVDMQDSYGKRGLQIVGVAIDNKQDVSDFMDTYFINYPVVIGSDNALKLMEQYGNHLGSLPYSVIIAADGKLVHRKIGAYSHKELDTLLQPHLLSTAAH